MVTMNKYCTQLLETQKELFEDNSSDSNIYQKLDVVLNK